MDSKILSETQFKFNKKYGQNFIFDKNLLSAIVADSNISKNDDVLEIGPGAGTLTRIIAENAKKVVAYEIDKNLCEVLEKSLDGVNNVNVIFEDALKTDINSIEKNFDGEYKLVANLPYYITTPLIFKFVQETRKVKSITIMVQKEVADRLVAKAGTSDYGTITTILDFYGNVSITRKVPRRMFIPSPNVDSAVVKIDIVNNKFDCNEQNFLKVVKSAFAMRRKTLVNNLTSGLNITKEKVIEVLQKMSLSETVRGESLNTKQFVELTNLLFNYNIFYKA